MTKKRKIIQRISNRDLISSLIAVAENLGYIPSAAAYDREGRFASETIKKRFGTWENAVKSAGLAELFTHKIYKHSDEDLLRSVRELAKDLGKMPSATDYARQGKFALSTISKRFGIWREVIKKSDLVWKENRRRPPLTEAELREDLKAVVNKLGRFPTQVEYNKNGRFSREAFYRFTAANSWKMVLRHFLKVSDVDIAALYRKDGDRLTQLKQIAKKLGVAPNTAEARKRGVNVSLLIKKYGSWKEVCTAANLGKPISRKTPGRSMSDAELWAEVRRVASRTGSFPKRDEFNKESRVNSKTVAKKLGQGKWSNVRKLFK